MSTATEAQQRRARGICSQAGCGNTPEMNPTTRLPYWMCVACRRKATRYVRNNRPSAPGNQTTELAFMLPEIHHV